jgi:hypothetical protein
LIRRLLLLATTLVAAGALVVGGFAVFTPESTPHASTPHTSLPALAESTDAGTLAGRLAGMAFVPTERPSIVAAAAEVGTVTLTTSTTLADLVAAAADSPALPSAPSSTTTTAPPTTTVPDTTTTVETTTTTTAPPTPTTTAPTPTTTTTVPDTTTTTTVETTTTTTVSAGVLTEAEMRTLAAAFFPAEEVEMAVEVARCESGLNSNAYNPSGPYGGLFQHYEPSWPSRASAAGFPGASIFDPTANTAAAHLVWQSGGWDPWPHCKAVASDRLGG